ncbi:MULTISPECIES: copper-binding protein [unclassified Caulobacter]|uniref:copper-binding protein n=1 Tax=unclassified Caulobacter TaxID=2648921 RepID=UPI000AF9F88F|nr:MULTISPECIES: copper-binding protein [unclassified Caulobacter]
MLADPGNFGKIMKLRNFAAIVAVLSLAACGKASQEGRSIPGVVEAVPSTESLPTYDAQGVISSLDGQILTLDHDGASAAGLKPGRDKFKVYADVIAEAPIAPGSRVKFQFKKTPAGLEVSKLEPRE